MYLRALAERWVNEPMEVFDEATQTFSASPIVGRVSLVDRFLSNFNRPLRRRMLHHAPDVDFPASRTLRVTATGDVYLVGQPREDSDAGQEYHALSVCHLVTDNGPGSSAGLATVRRNAPAGPANDPGWLVESVIGYHYVDIEFRTSLNEQDLEQERRESFVMWLQQNADLKPHDFIDLHSRSFRVTDVYPDSGFMMARIDEEEDYLVDLVIKVNDSTTYDPNLRKYVATPQSYNVTGLLTSVNDFGAWVTDSEDYISLAINEDHIGFRPKSGMVISYDGVDRTVHHSHYSRGERQYKLRIR